MTIAEVKSMLEAISGFSTKVVYWSWPEGEAPGLPFICYHTPATNNFAADGIAYFVANEFIIELYSELKDTTTEALIEAQLNAYGIYWDKDSTYLDSESCWMTTYEIEV